MERFSQGENVLLGYSPQRSFENLPKSQNNSNSDMDFSDVFGGPPRRFSIQEVRMRYSFNETMESDQEEAVFPRSPWSGFEEKPVFGAESGSRRQYPSDGFFDDIFRGDESKSHSSPRRNSGDPFGSNPGSRVLSPGRPLPPKAEPFSTSLPAQFSLPAKLTKAMEFPVFASANHSLYNSKDGISNGISYGHTSNISLSRFSSQASELLGETRISNSFHHQSPVSHEVSCSSEELEFETKSDVKDKEDKLKNDPENLEAPISSSQFHFSIYKWAGKGVTLMTPLMVGNRLRSKERSKVERCSSTNGRLQFGRFDSKMRLVEDHIVSVDNESLSGEIKYEKPEERIKEIQTESHNTVRETHPDIPELKSHETSGHAIPFGWAISSKKTVEESISDHAVDLCKKSENEIYVNKEQATKPKLKPFRSFLDDKKQEQGDTTEGEESAVRTANVSNKNVNSGNSVKQASAKRTNTNQAEVTDDKSQSSTNLGDAPGNNGAKGKVREFVKIFNQETSAKSRANFDNPSQSSRWKGIDINGKENEMSNISKKEEKVHVHNKKKMPDTSLKEEFNFNTEKCKQDPCLKSSVDKNCSRVTNEKNASLFSDSFPAYAEVEVENRESFQGHFLVEELSQAPDKDLQTGGGSEDIKALDAKIQQWSNGRKGNIRSLLSTLQYILWPGSGWKPVPLVDIIEGSAVKRAYQKALLCLHPDKLQQKGAGTDQKYIAEKAFDILQEAWDHFNSLCAI